MGLGISTRGGGSMVVQEAKRQGLIFDILSQLQAAAAGRKVARSDIEQRVGRLSHIAQVAQEGNAYLQPLYRMMCAAYWISVRGRGRADSARLERRRVRPRGIHIAGSSPGASA